MGASTMIMAPAVDSSTAFPRSHSSPDLLTLSALDRPAPTFSLNQHQQQRPLGGQTLSSLPSLPDFDVPSFNSDFSLDTSLFLAGSKADPSLPAPVVRTEVVPVETPRSNTKAKSKTKLARTRTNSLVERPRWLPNSLTGGDPQTEIPPRPTTSAGDMSFGGGSSSLGDLKPLHKSTSTSSFASFAKRSWRSSRSPSPMEKPDAAKETTGRERSESTASIKLTKARQRPGLTVEQAEKNHSNDSLKAAPKAFRASSYFSKKKQKPTALSKLNTNTNLGSDNSCASSATSLVPPASSTDGRRTPQLTPVDTNTTVTDESSIEMPPQIRDALWSTFKTLDMEIRGFTAKSTAQRMVVVQSLVFPFLRNTMTHESLKRLYPEDVDRRATILNKWWVVVLEMLEGQSPQPLPGVDRQILYEVATLMMMRPEWRHATSYFQPLASRSPAERIRARSCTNSSGSSMTSSQAAFLEESAEHNVRTMFVTNLVRQMAFVVEKLSLRNAPMGLVNFAGKACAYAFYFAPGVSDILIRLWGLSPELIRRVADQFGLPRRNKGESDDIVALFPPNLSMFGWTTPRGMWDNLKQVPKLPVLMSRIPWTGPWVARWKGRDTDLFFIFCKYFHVLSEQFMPPGLPLIEKARSPAFALIHAQLLFVMDTTVHRPNTTDAGYGPTFDSMQGGADTALTLPLPPGNVMKGMSENRLIMLLKDFLSDEGSEIAEARHTFAEAFASLMKASTRKTSQFNHTACFTLCDFLEEVLVLYSEFEDPDSSTRYIDWTFWFDVCKKIMSSFNTMSEVRMMALIFSIWDAIAKDPQRKLALCHDWILSEETFNEFFNHWCPMVRAYYQRLICWRMCRDNGKQDEVDVKIFNLVARRLRTTWAHYLYLKHTAEQEERPPPSTAPVLPAPGKRFMIIRQEVNMPQPGLFMGFDASGKSSSNSDIIASVGVSDVAPAKNDSKKRWSLLGKVLSLGSNNTDWDDELQAARRDTAEGRSSFTLPPAKTPTFSGPKGARFSDDDLPIYEEPKFVFKFILAWQNQAAPFRDRFLTRPRLPAPAQARLSSPPRSNSPQVPPGNFTPPKRKFSGSPQLGGLISGARNASPLSSPTDERPRRLSLGLNSANGFSDISLPDMGDRNATPTGRKDSPAPSTPAQETHVNTDRFDDGITEPIKPTGTYTKNVVYAGRALAEWAQVVFECNNFVDRRRDEGVFHISDMEIPILGVEGFRKVGA